MARKLSEILIDADNAQNLESLIKFWNEIAENKYSYPLVEIRFANEHIRELALKVNGEDFEKGKFYMALKSQLANSF